MDKVYWIWFQLLFGIASRRTELLTQYVAHPKQLYEDIAGNGPISTILQKDELDASETALQRARQIEQRTLKLGCSIVTMDSSEYPQLLKDIQCPPVVLYVKGELDCLEDRLAVAMVGTRNYTEYGSRAAQLIAGRLAENGAVIVSGLAHGIDTECHRAALEAGGETIGILGCGLDIDYPKGSSSIKSAMSCQGAVISEFPMGTQPYRTNFPLRNRIISGMSHATVVVEAETKSGSLITARLAKEQGRDVFAVPGSIFLRREQGAHKLIKEGARLADDAEDILALYPQFPRIKQLYRPVKVQSPKPPMKENAVKNMRSFEEYVPAAEENQPDQKSADHSNIMESASAGAIEVYALLGEEIMTVDELASKCTLATGEILSALTELELYGIVLSHPGRKFSIIN